MRGANTLKWKESSEFSKLYQRELGVHMSSQLKLVFFFVTLVISIFIWAISGFVAKLWLVVLTAVVIGLLLIFFFNIVLGAPQKVSLTKKGVLIGYDRLVYGDLDCVRLGFVEFEQKKYPIIAFITGSKDSLVGLPDESYFQKIREYLKPLGVRVEE